MGGCLAAVFKDPRGTYRPLRTTTTARYGTNSRSQTAIRGGRPDPKIGTGKSKGEKRYNTKDRTTKGGSTTQCPQCQAQFTFKRDLNRHIREVHAGQVTRPSKPRAKEEAEDVPIGGAAGESARQLQWSDLSKSDQQLIAEQYARDHPNEFRREERAESTKKTSRYSRAKKWFSRTKDAIKRNAPTRGTRGTSSTTRKKKVKRKK